MLAKMATNLIVSFFFSYTLCFLSLELRVFLYQDHLIVCFACKTVNFCQIIYKITHNHTTQQSYTRTHNSLFTHTTNLLKTKDYIIHNNNLNLKKLSTTNHHYCCINILITLLKYNLQNRYLTIFTNKRHVIILYTIVKFNFTIR